VVLFWGVLVVALVFVIAAVAIGREARRLSDVPPRPVFDLDEAVAWVADHVPFEVAAELSHDDVRRIIGWQLEYFRTRGLSGNGHGPDAPTGPIVVGGAEAVDYVLDRARGEGTEYHAAHVHAVLEAQMGYLEAIGAVGPPGEGPGPTGA
jgi:hypothetical protein